MVGTEAGTEVEVGVEPDSKGLNKILEFELSWYKNLALATAVFPVIVLSIIISLEFMHVKIHMICTKRLQCIGHYCS